MKTIPGKRLTSTEVADLLGVSEASVKRWADSGLLSTEKTAGGHRRFRPEDVAAFRRATQGHLAERRERQASVAVPPPHTAVAAQITADDELANTMFEQIVGGRDEEASATAIRGARVWPATMATSSVGAAPRSGRGRTWRGEELRP